MPNQPYTRVTERFQCNGIDLNNPLDNLTPGYYPYLLNVRAFSDGTLQPRQGVVSTSTGIAAKTPFHSVRRLNSPMTSTSTGAENWTRIAGTGDALGYGTAALTQATYNASNVAYDGNPLILTPYRPDQATTPFMYIATQVGNNVGNGYLRQMKINRAGTVHQWGVPAPIYPPKVELSAWNNFAYNNAVGSGGIGYNFTATTNWTGAGNRDGTVITGDPTLTDRLVASVITAVRYDSGSTGWCNVILPAAAMSVMGVGSQWDFITGGPTVTTFVIHEVYPGSAATTVGTVIYDSDVAPTNQSIATIQPVKSIPELKRNCIVAITIAAALKYFRVISTRTAADGSISCRVQGDGANTIAAAQPLQVVSSVRIYDTGAGFAVGGGDTVSEKDLSVTCANVTGTGWFQNVTNTADLSVANATGANRAFSDDDYVHISLKCSDWSRITQGRILLNCDIEATATFTKNYFYRTFTANDLQPSSQNTPAQTAIDNRANVINRRMLDGGQPAVIRTGPGDDSLRPGERDRPDNAPPQKVGNPDDPNAPVPSDPSRSQAGTGASQWSELRFRIGDLKINRVGTDVSRGLANINGMRIELTVVAGTGTFTFEVNSFTAWGSYPLDTGDIGEPYIYRCRARCSTTGARSNYSPPSFGGVIALRESITVSPYQASTSTRYGRSSIPAEVDYIDIERLGGTLTNWTYVGSVAINVAFVDSNADDVIASNIVFSEGDTNYQPWPIRSAPISGTFSTLAGTMGTSTTSLNTDIAKGTAIRVQRTDNSFIDTTIRRIIDTGTGNGVNVEFADSVGSGTNVIYTIAEPLITGLPLPAFWTWNDMGFACGDINNPGVLYWTNGNNIDGTQDTSYLEITSPSEPLMNGCAFNGKNYVWSTERMFELEQIAPGVFMAIQIPGNKGLASIYGLCVGERLWYVSRDGIYQTGGGDSISITDETLKQLFVKEGNVGTAINGFNPPDFTVPNKIRLSYYDGYLYFVYQDTVGGVHSMAYTARNEKPGWWPDSYLDGQGVIYFYGEEGSVYTSGKPTSIVHSLLACGGDGKLYKVSGSVDGVGPIPATVRTQYFDAQDRRADKRWGDLILDANTGGIALNLTAYTNNSTSTSNQLSLSPTTMTSTSRAQQMVDISAGGDPAADYSRNMALEIGWSSTAAIPELFLWEPSYTLRPEAAVLRASPWDDAGFEGDKFFQGVEITADTNNVARTVQVEYDGQSTNVGDTLTVQHSNKITKAYAFRPAFTAGTIRLHPTDTGGNWKLYAYRWIAQPEPPLGERWESQPTSFGADNFIHMKSAYVTMKSTQNVTLTVTRQEDSHTDTYTIPTTSGLKTRQYVPFVVTKGKGYTFVFSTTSTGGQFRLYKDGTTVLMKPWQSEEAFADRSPFGAPTGDGQAPI